MMEGTRVRWKGESLFGDRLEAGALGTVVRGTDYAPGWDAGVWTVVPDDFPEASAYGHRAMNYWTAPEMLESWEVMVELVAVRVELKNDAGDTRIHYGYGATSDEAVRAAEVLARWTGEHDESWVMNEWTAA